MVNDEVTYVQASETQPQIITEHHSTSPHVTTKTKQINLWKKSEGHQIGRFF